MKVTVSSIEAELNNRFYNCSFLWNQIKCKWAN